MGLGGEREELMRKKLSGVTYALNKEWEAVDYLKSGWGGGKGGTGEAQCNEKKQCACKSASLERILWRHESKGAGSKTGTNWRKK